MRSLLLAALLCGCAVKGYDLGWRVEDRLSPLLGQPLDALGSCRFRHGEGAAPPACAGLVREVRAVLASLPPVAEAPRALGARCAADRCQYSNSYQRRDVGLATLLPVYRKVSLRVVRMRLERSPTSGWRLAELVIADTPPPSYGPVRIGGGS